VIEVRKMPREELPYLGAAQLLRVIQDNPNKILNLFLEDNLRAVFEIGGGLVRIVARTEWPERLWKIQNKLPKYRIKISFADPFDKSRLRKILEDSEPDKEVVIWIKSIRRYQAISYYQIRFAVLGSNFRKKMEPVPVNATQSLIAN